MADFHQTGVITSLHRLGEPNLPRLESELVRYGKERPIALVLPSLYAEIHGPALKQIVEELGFNNHGLVIRSPEGKTLWSQPDHQVVMDDVNAALRDLIARR